MAIKLFTNTHRSYRLFYGAGKLAARFRGLLRQILFDGRNHRGERTLTRAVQTETGIAVGA